MTKYKNNLKELQNDLLITAAEIAEATEANVGTVYGWLNGNHEMPIKKRKLFKEKFGVDPYDRSYFANKEKRN